MNELNPERHLEEAERLLGTGQLVEAMDCLERGQEETIKLVDSMRVDRSGHQAYAFSSGEITRLRLLRENIDRVLGVFEKARQEIIHELQIVRSQKAFEQEGENDGRWLQVRA